MHHVVQLDGPLQLLPLRFPHTFTKYPSTSPSELSTRISTATIVIAVATKIPRQAILSSPNVQLYAWLGAGTDNIDAVAVKEARNVTLTNTPAQNTTTVAEHALGLYFGVKRRVVGMDGYVRRGDWRDGYPIGEFGGVPRVCEEEVVGIVGYGALGQRVEKLCKALDMSVLIAERKSAPKEQTRPGRTPFTEVLSKCTVLFILCPLEPTTHNMLSGPELALLSPTTLLINVARGGIVNEAALADALREGKIGGAGIDVFETEPATKETTPLLADGVKNLVVSPHVAWFSGRTVEGTKEMVRTTIEKFVEGNPINVLVGSEKK